ncbi:MAG: YcgL domain-containing protein [Leclercia sp.]
MFCVIYRSTQRDQTYLYVEKKDDFSRVPEALLKSFGKPLLVMLMPLDGRKQLRNADLEKVKNALTEQGYYLQLPPPQENLLKQHLAEQGKN